MRLIGHRGLIDGPSDRENHPDQIRSILYKGFDAEIDLRVIDGKLMLGHDEPTYEVPYEFISKLGLWIHCKNFEALEYMRNCVDVFNFFWHDQDDFTITSRGYIWTYPRKPLMNRSIWVQPEWDADWRDQVNQVKDTSKCFGICSKYVREIKENF